jgi:hypothetical protein
VVAEVEEAQAFGPRCQQEARRLGVAVAATGLSVLGDGAEWIWNRVEQHFAGATPVLDVYHGVEKLAEAGREAFGAGTAAPASALDQTSPGALTAAAVSVQIISPPPPIAPPTPQVTVVPPQPEIVVPPQPQIDAAWHPPVDVPPVVIPTFEMPVIA